MTYTEAKQKLRNKQKLARETWEENFYIEAEDPKEGYKLKLIDSCGRRLRTLRG